jgi:hypothetical protein
MPALSIRALGRTGQAAPGMPPRTYDLATGRLPVPASLAGGEAKAIKKLDLDQK